MNKEEDSDEYEFSTDSEKDSEYDINESLKADNSDTESDSELELISKSFKDSQRMDESLSSGIQRIKKFIEKNNQKLQSKFGRNKTNGNQIFLNKKRKYDN